MSGSFSLLAEFLTHPVFVGAMTILGVGGALCAVSAYITHRTQGDLSFILAWVFGILTFAVVMAFLMWSP